MAIDFAMVLGLTGVITSVSFFMAVVTGEQPVACAANIFEFTMKNPIVTRDQLILLNYNTITIYK